MLNSGKKFHTSPWLLENKFLNETKKHNIPWKLNGPSLNCKKYYWSILCRIAAVLLCLPHSSSVTFGPGNTLFLGTFRLKRTYLQLMTA
jgi:hypothetical protein